MKREIAREDKWALIGIVIGVALAIVIVFLFAVESTMIVRYLIMASGLVLGWAGGRWLARRGSAN